MTIEQDKRFLYDILIGARDVCDRENEIERLLAAARGDRRTLLLAPRRYGKTSLVKNIVGPAARRFRPKRIVIAVDLMSVATLGSISSRLQHGIERALAESFSPARIVDHASRMLRMLSVGVELDPLTGAPQVKIGLQGRDEHKSILALSDALQALEKRHPLVLILDEFQDVNLVAEAEGLMRPLLQDLTRTSVFILGSKRHLMERMIGSANAPLFQYGDEMTLGPIALAAWEPYFAERLEARGTTISTKGLEYLLERMCDVPNAICEIGAWLQERHAGQRIEAADVESALDAMVELKQGYAYRLSGATVRERELLIGVARAGFLREPMGAAFVSRMGISKSTISKTLHRLLDTGFLEIERDRGWRLSDPVLAHYLRRQMPA
jgi:DNA-binding transcriptional ArsR family regulator